MTSYDAWLDTEEVKRLAGQLLEPVPVAPPQSPPDPSFGADFVGFAAEVSAVKGQPAPAPASSSLDALRSRLGGYGSTGMLLLDPQGSAVFSEGDAGRFQPLALDLLHAPSANLGGVRLKVGALEWLELVPLGSAESRRVFAAVVTRPLDPEIFRQIESALG